MVGVGTLHKRGASMSGHFRREERWNSAQGLCEITINNRAKDTSSVVSARYATTVSRHSGEPRIVVRGSASRKETRGKLDYRFRVMTQRRADLHREFLSQNPTLYRNSTFASSDRYFSVRGWSDPRTSKI